MKLTKLTAVVFFCAAVIAGCGATAIEPVSASDDFAASWDAADAKRKEAAGMGAEWRDTGKMLKAAKKASEEGDAEKAMKLVAKAQEQSEDAIAQFKREGDLWASRVPH